MQPNHGTKDYPVGESSFVVKPYHDNKKERTEEAICTWLGCWESHFELHPKPDSTKISYITRELGGKVIT
jgi:hypothetical protein